MHHPKNSKIGPPTSNTTLGGIVLLGGMCFFAGILVTHRNVDPTREPKLVGPTYEQLRNILSDTVDRDSVLQRALNDARTKLEAQQAARRAAPSSGTPQNLVAETLPHLHRFLNSEVPEARPARHRWTALPASTGMRLANVQTEPPSPPDRVAEDDDQSARPTSNRKQLKAKFDARFVVSLQHIEDAEARMKQQVRRTRPFEQGWQDSAPRARDFEQSVTDSEQSIRETEQSIRDAAQSMRDFEQTVMDYPQPSEGADQRAREAEQRDREAGQRFREGRTRYREADQRWIQAEHRTSQPEGAKAGPDGELDRRLNASEQPIQNAAEDMKRSVARMRAFEQAWSDSNHRPQDLDRNMRASEESVRNAEQAIRSAERGIKNLEERIAGSGRPGMTADLRMRDAEQRQFDAEQRAKDAERRMMALDRNPRDLEDRPKQSDANLENLAEVPKTEPATAE